MVLLLLMMMVWLHLLIVVVRNRTVREVAPDSNRTSGVDVVTVSRLVVLVVAVECRRTRHHVTCGRIMPWLRVMGLMMLMKVVGDRVGLRMMMMVVGVRVAVLRMLLRVHGVASPSEVSSG